MRFTAGMLLLALSAPVNLVAQNVAPPAARDVSWRKLLPNIATDQKTIWWGFPRDLAHGRHLLPVAAVVGTAAALIAVDPHDAPYFRSTTAFHGFNQVFSSRAASIGMVAAPVSMYAAGLVKRDSKLQRTALFAGEAVADAEILATAMKAVDRRIRPSTIQPGGDFADTWFKNSKPNGCFPSGHTIAAFSIATVISRQYGTRHKWVPFLAYGLAATVGFSRITLSAHFLSDVFMGGALGYTIGRFVVLRQ